jgi:hypothetical protein
MSSLSVRAGGGLETFPLFHVQDLKNGDVDGGFGSTTLFAKQDITTILRNDINGATLTTDNSGTVTSGVVGIHGDITAPINNPASGGQFDKCFITLPAGTYISKLSFGFHNSSPAGKIYNRTAAADIQHFIPYTSYGSSNGMNIYETKFTLSVQSDLDYREILLGSSTPTIQDMGYKIGVGNSLTKMSYMDWRIYKIG